MRRHLAVCILVLGVLTLSASRCSAQQFNYASIDVPCSAAPPTSCPNGIARQTVANGINPGGDIVGVFTDGVGKPHAFLLSGGQFTTIDVPGAVRTSAKGIAPSGEIVGNYTAPFIPGVSDSAPVDSPAYCPASGVPACIKGFLYRHGKFSTVLFPGHPGAIPQRITPDGDIYGCLHDFDLMNSMFSAAWTHFGDTSLTANGGELADPTLSFPNSMHGGATPDGKIMVGFYVDMMTGHTHGYVLQSGALQTYDVLNSVSTTIWDINPGHEFVGTYVDGAGKGHGFLQTPDGSAPINLDYPGAAATVAFGINPGGVIVGQYSLGGHVHGFVAVPVTSN